VTTPEKGLVPTSAESVAKTRRLGSFVPIADDSVRRDLRDPSKLGEELLAFKKRRRFKKLSTAAERMENGVS
jgi:hypothetical protein